MPMVRGYRWMYRTARPAIDMSTMPGRGCIFHDIGNYPSRDHDTRKYHLSFGGACQTPIQWPTTTHLSLSTTIFTPSPSFSLYSSYSSYHSSSRLTRLLLSLTLLFFFDSPVEENNLSPRYILFLRMVNFESLAKFN